MKEYIHLHMSNKDLLHFEPGTHGSNRTREGVGVGKGLGRRRTSLGPNQVVKGRRVRDTGSKVLQVPQVAQSLQDRGGRVSRGLTGDRVGTVVLNVAGGGVGRHEPSRHTATETVEAEGVRATIGGSLGVGLVVRADSQWRSNVVEETTGLVIGDEQESLVPLRTGPNGVVDLLDEDLAERDVAGGVHGVGVQATAGRVDVGKLGQEAEVGILVEVLKRNNVRLGVLCGPVVEQGVGEEGTVGAIVVEPRDIVRAGSFEDAVNGDARNIEAVVIVAVAISSARECEETVRVGGLSAR